MFCRHHRKNTSYKLWSEAETLTTMGSGWEQALVGEICLQQYMGQFVISLYYSSTCKHRQHLSMSTNGLGIWCEVIIFSVIWWPHEKYCSHYIMENCLFMFGCLYYTNNSSCRKPTYFKVWCFLQSANCHPFYSGRHVLRVSVNVVWQLSHFAQAFMY